MIHHEGTKITKEVLPGDKVSALQNVGREELTQGIHQPFFVIFVPFVVKKS